MCDVTPSQTRSHIASYRQKQRINEATLEITSKILFYEVDLLTKAYCNVSYWYL